MFIQGALANVNKEVSTDEFLEFLSKNLPSADFFKLQPPPGVIMAAAIDWRGILHDAAAIATLAQVLWSAYTTFIKPIHDENPNSDAAIFFQMKNENGQFDQFMIGKDIRDKQVLIQRIDQSVKVLNVNQNLPKEEIYEIESSGYWVHIK